jgi:hypothetical protein
MDAISGSSPDAALVRWQNRNAVNARGKRRNNLLCAGHYFEQGNDKSDSQRDSRGHFWLFLKTCESPKNREAQALIIGLFLRQLEISLPIPPVAASFQEFIRKAMTPSHSAIELFIRRFALVNRAIIVGLSIFWLDTLISGGMDMTDFRRPTQT